MIKRNLKRFLVIILVIMMVSVNNGVTYAEIDPEVSTYVMELKEGDATQLKDMFDKCLNENSTSEEIINAVQKCVKNLHKPGSNTTTTTGTILQGIINYFLIETFDTENLNNIASPGNNFLINTIYNR